MHEAIELVPQHKIERLKWDDCVAASPHPNVFMYTWAMDALCDNWSGIVINGYQAVIPFPWRRKFGLKYVYQVPFLPKLSLMNIHGTPVNNNAIRKILQQNFRLIHTDTDNLDTPAKWVVRERLNYLLQLNAPYEQLAGERFTASCRKNIHKATARHCMLSHDMDIPGVINLYDAAYGKLQAAHSQRNYSNAASFAKEALMRQMADIYAVKSNITGENLMGAIVLREKGRLYYWLGAPSPAGRDARATYFFIDQLIRLHAGTNAVLDFEGSDIPSVKQFYGQFGPQEEWYKEIKKINLL